ncbi:DNA adenine methylase [bacterium]|nr:DNA adenine methylase [bacterium]
MSYVGGKARGASHILAVLNDKRFDGYDYLEPFVGYAHVLHRVRNKRSYIASDANPLVVALLRGVQRGEALPPITRARYAQLKAAVFDASFERAVAAFQWSFNGKEWGGYVHHYTRPNGAVDDIPASRARHYATLRASPAFQASMLTHSDQNSLKPPYGNVTSPALTREGRRGHRQ